MSLSPDIAEVLQAAGATVFERGWLSSNNVLFHGAGRNALVDSGYGAHAALTLALVEQVLGDAPLQHLLNTHLHSDHCGGNAALQARYPALRTLIPPGQAEAVRTWDEDALTYRPTGQVCPPFHFDGLLQPGQTVALGPMQWEVHGAKGHDPHAILLYQPDVRLLISADALWHNGFGVVFPELEGIHAFHEVADTLDIIESLAPRIVIPGHGPVFQDVGSALERARNRLHQHLNNPDGHRRHAIKVLIKFRLLEWQQIELEALMRWARQTPYLAQAMPEEDEAGQAWLASVLAELERSGALQIEGNRVLNR